MKIKTKLLILSLGLVSLAWMACRTESPQETVEVKTSISLAPVERMEISKEIHTYGRLATKEEIKLSFKIPGIIDRILVDEGQKVSQGQLLARLNLSEIDSQVKQAESAFEKAERDLERVENLYQEKAATLEQYQNVQTAHRVAKSRLQAAQFNKKFSSIRAPSNGRILKRLMEENEMAGAGYPVFIFASTENDWIVRSGISDRDLVRIQLDDPAIITFDAYPGKKFRARVVEIVESADPMTGTYEIELRMDPSDQRFISGFVAKVDIIPSQKSSYQVIPASALVEAQGKKGSVFACDRGTKTVHKIPVVIGFLFDDRVAVVSGLEDIGEVVAQGAPYLSDGEAVRIIDQNE